MWPGLQTLPALSSGPAEGPGRCGPRGGAEGEGFRSGSVHLALHRSPEGTCRQVYRRSKARRYRHCGAHTGSHQPQRLQRAPTCLHRVSQPHATESIAHRLSPLFCKLCLIWFFSLKRDYVKKFSILPLSPIELLTVI